MVSKVVGEKVTSLIGYVNFAHKEQFLLPEDTENEWIMYYVKSGTYTFRMEGCAGVGRESSLIVCPPDTILRRKIIDPVDLSLFRFVDVPEGVKGPKSYDFSRLLKNARLESDLLNLIDCCRGSRNSVLAEHFLDDILITMYFGLTVSKQEEITNHDLLTNAITFLTSPQYFNLSINEIAEKLFVSPSYLSRFMKGNVGCSPMVYRNNSKAGLAKKMLRKPGMRISQIAQNLGFDDPLYFSRFFKVQTGYSPSQYRKRINGIF